MNKSDTAIAVMGAGLIGKRHIEHSAKLGCLCAIVDPDENAKQLAQHHGAAYFRSVTELIDSGLAQGVIVATPTQYHVDNTTALVKAGIPALIEKPIADKLDEAKQLVTLAADNKVPLMVGHHRRFNPLIQAAKAKIEEGVIGNLVAANAMCWLYKPDDYFDVPWRQQPGAGPLLTNLIHDIDLMRYFCGDVDSVQMLQSNSTRNHNVEDTAALLIRFKNNTVATMSVSDTIVAPWSWEMTANENPVYPNTNQSCYVLGGTHGSLAIPDMQHWHNAEDRGWYEPMHSDTIPTEALDPLIVQIEHFCNVIEGKAEPLVSGLEGLKTLQVLDAAYEAARTGSTVFVTGT